jgi:hypothetical protein
VVLRAGVDDQRLPTGQAAGPIAFAGVLGGADGDGEDLGKVVAVAQWTGSPRTTVRVPGLRV